MKGAQEASRRWARDRAQLVDAYTSGEAAFLPFLLPEAAIALPDEQVLGWLKQRLSADLLASALDPEQSIPSPLAGLQSAEWIKQTNMVGVNIRAIGGFWNLVKYTLTLPAQQQAIHLLPIWEPGVVSSLYGMASWNINPEFFSQALYQAFPHLDTVERQLKAVINLLHADGRVLGMDVIPHTDRYSEIVLANPRHFEWMRRSGDQIVDHRADLHEEVEAEVFRFLRKQGPAGKGLGLPDSAAAFFSPDTPEEKRLQGLFGQLRDYGPRAARRGQLVQQLYDLGYEPVPATMGPPYRGIAVDPSPDKQSTDGEGRTWYEYRITKPQEMSRVFGPLARYKLYERLDDNKDWGIDFSRPREATWAYVCEHYHRLQQSYNFAFMRGDMSHVQMRPEGVPLAAGPYYDLHRAVKEKVSQAKPYFGYFAETFLVGPGFIAYGNEPDHLEQAAADATLGDLQSMVPGSAGFLQHFRQYLDLLATRQFAPSFTMMTGDKDDPRFDHFYLHGNEARLFTALFLSDMPSYMGAGFECRDPHPEPAPNEHYTKLYVFKISEGPKGTKGPYVWGKNETLYYRLSRLRLTAESLRAAVSGQQSLWLLPPDATGSTRVLAWSQRNQGRLLFVVNYGNEAASNIKIPLRALARTEGEALSARLIFSTHTESLPASDLAGSPLHWQIETLLPGECQIYRLTEHEKELP